MDPSIRRAALRAAAKVALSVTALTSASLVACSATSSNDDTATQDELRRGRDAAPPPTLAECRDKVDELLASNTTLPKTKEVKTCCAIVLDAHFDFSIEDASADGAPLDEDAGNAMVGAEFKRKGSCCKTVATEEQPWGTHLACTPWGPPMPPSMDLGVA